MVEFCNEKCGPDCKDGCFFVPMITLNHTESEYFSNVINNCACIPCYDYIAQTGDIKCFQKDTVPEILQILVDNFKKHPDFEGAYSASGWGGQFITVIPKLNIVVVHKYKVPTLVNWGLKQGGVSDWAYWTLLYDFVKSEQ